MAQSIRVLYRGVQGRLRANFNWPPIKQNSAVVITAAEWATSGPVEALNGRPHLGDANVYVTNIGPHNPEGGSGGVEFHVHADWDSPLDVIVTISVLEDVETFMMN